MKKINPVEKFLRSNPRIASIIYFSTLGYIGFNIYSDIILSEPNNSSNSFLGTIIFFFFLYMTYIVIMIQKDNNDKKKSK